MRILRSVSDRDGMLGASDSAVALGFSPFKTRTELWLEKTGRLEAKSLADVEAVRFGTLFEDVVANEFGLRLGLKLRRENLMTVHRVYPFIGGHIDRRVVAQPCGVEIKTTSEAAFRTLWGEPGSDQAPDFVSTPSYAEVRAQLEAADDRDALDIAVDLIRFVEPKFQDELRAIADEVSKRIEGGA